MIQWVLNAADVAIEYVRKDLGQGDYSRYIVDALRQSQGKSAADVSKPSCRMHWANMNDGAGSVMRDTLSRFLHTQM